MTHDATGDRCRSGSAGERRALPRAASVAILTMLAALSCTSTQSAEEHAETARHAAQGDPARAGCAHETAPVPAVSTDAPLDGIAALDATNCTDAPEPELPFVLAPILPHEPFDCDDGCVLPRIVHEETAIERAEPYLFGLAVALALALMLWPERAPRTPVAKGTAP
jgi:hypothetical protein